MAYAHPEICPSCCPRGGAIFRRDMVLVDGDYQWHDKVCQNCGYVKAPRKRQARTLINPMTCSAAEAENLNAAKRAAFHYFNPAGVLGEWKAFGQVIDAANSEGIVKPGFWLAYGPNGYHRDQLARNAMARRPRPFNVDYTVQAIRETIARGRERLIEAAHEHGYAIEEIEALAKKGAVE